MNVEHLRTFLWLRWRILVNQLRRAGVANSVVLTILAAAAITFATAAFVAAVLVGAFALPLGSSDVLLVTWSGVVVAFLFCWLMGVAGDIQRCDDLALNKFLHLPISLSSAFLVNYLSSLLSLTLLAFVPAMFGLILGTAVGITPLMLLLAPVVVALVVMVTALTYQFQGWLATLMANKRRRRTIVVVVTAAVIVLAQTPNLINVVRPWKESKAEEGAASWREEQERLSEALARGEITPAEHQERVREADEARKALKAEKEQAAWSRVVAFVKLADTIAPPGWLPLAARGLAEGSPWMALLATLGLGLVGTGSLWRGYRTTLRLYTGQYTAGKGRPATTKPTAVPSGERGVTFLEWRLPWLSEPASAVALATVRSLLRAPEAKMAFLIPIILVLVIGTMFFVRRADVPELLRPLLPFAAMAMALATMIQIPGNQFGFERNGFRALVLCPAPRRDLLLGKNLAVAPFAAAIGLVLVVLGQTFAPMRWWQLLAVAPMMATMYLLYCVPANFLSIYTPLRVNPGSLKTSNVKLIPVLLQLLVFSTYPLVMAPALLPIGVQLLLDWRGVLPGVPVGFVLGIVVLLASAYLYRLVLDVQGRQLQTREQAIVEVVTTRAE